MFSLCDSTPDLPAREVKRKQYASHLFHLSSSEIAEEEGLFLEIKKMEQNQRRYQAERDDLLRRTMGLDSGLVNLDQNNGEGVVGMDKVTWCKYIGLVCAHPRRTKNANALKMQKHLLLRFPEVQR
jgi:hypothetical protein